MGDVDHTGLTTLFSRLCELHVRDKRKAFLVQPTYSREYHLKRLRKKLYDTVFQFLKGPHRVAAVGSRYSQGVGNELDQLYALAFHLRCQRKFDNANRLEELVEKVTKDDSRHTRQMLKLLVCLSGTGTTGTEQVMGQAQIRLPSICTGKQQKNRRIMPEGPMHFGDTCLQQTDNKWYTHFPREVFELKGMTASQSGATEQAVCDIKVFEMKPGEGLPGSGVFKAKGLLNDSYEHKSETTLFGALIHSRTRTIDTKLDLPELSDTTCSLTSFDLKPSRFFEFSEDEGFGSSKAVSLSSSTSTLVTDRQTEEEEGDIWEQALQYTPSQHYVWEHRGGVPGPREKPFLSEAGSEVFNVLCQARQNELLTLDPSLQFPERIEISMSDLVLDILNLLIGVPSYTFLFDAGHQEFRLEEGVCLHGMSTLSLRQATLDFLECGTNYYRLTEFSQPPVMDSFYSAGLIFQAFTEAVRNYLQYYRACILSIPKGKTLMELKFLVLKLITQTRFLAELCMCSMSPKQPPSYLGEESFPTGIRLLSYLYREALDTASSPHYPMMLSLLSTSCAPYLMFIQDWVFHGLCRDAYGEFMIQINDDYLRYRDAHYWTHGFQRVAHAVHDSVPLFLSDLANDMFVCGKSINLLRLCAPQHFLFMTDISMPRVAITFSEEDLALIDQRCQIYLGRMQQLARQDVQSRVEQEERALRAKQDLMAKAARMAADELDRLQAKIKEKKRAVDLKKRQEFKELKEQMEKDLLRRAAEQEQENLEDAVRMETATRQELLEADMEEELEEQARQELIEYYGRLTEEAAFREQRALWKVRRHKLDLSRRAFIEENEAALLEELDTQRALYEVQSAEHAAQSAVTPSDDPNILLVTGAAAQSSKDVPDLASGEMPTWAQEAAARPVEFDNREDTNADLPNWAKEGLKGPLVPAFGLDFSLDQLPSWAKQGMDGPEEPLVVPDMALTEEPSVSGSIEEQVKKSTKSHPSDAQVSDLMRIPPEREERLLKLESGESDFKSWTESGSRIKAHPSESSVEALLYPGLGSPTDKGGPGDLAGSGAEGSGKSGTRSEKKESESQPEEKEKSSPQSESPEEPVAGECKDIAGGTPILPKRRLTPRKHKPQIRIQDNIHATTESGTEQPTRSSVKIQQKMHITQESEAAEYGDKLQVKILEGRHVSQQTEEEEGKLHVKVRQDLHATTETTQEEIRAHLKSVEGKCTSQETQQTNEQVAPHRKMFADRGIAVESVPTEPKVIKPSIFGHVSDLSRGEYEILAPKLKKSANLHVSAESDFACFQIKPHRKAVKGLEISDETSEREQRPMVKMSSDRHMSKESEHVDTDGIRLKKFKERNLYGHSSDSTVQRLLYGDNFGQGLNDQDEERKGDTPEKEDTSDMELWSHNQMDRYNDNFDLLNDPPRVDLLVGVLGEAHGDMVDFSSRLSADIKAHEFVSLPVLLKRSVTAPLDAQITLVNQVLVDYFMSELNIELHFEALRQYLFLQDGEFGQMLSDQLFEKLSTNPLPHEMLNPVFLNGVLNKACRTSPQRDRDLSANLSFALKYIPQVLQQNSADALDCLELRYKVDWPQNIVITDNCMNKYSQVFSFMLQLKRTVWVLKDVWHQLKRDALINKASHAPQIRQLQLYRHEMQHFVKVMQGYIAHQVIHVTWQEFKQDLNQHVHNADDLHLKHVEYLNKCVFRCLLNKKAAPVMKIIQDIFCLILKFRTQLTSHWWQQDRHSEELVHPAFDNMTASYKAFKDYSSFLFRVVNKLATRGYQTHLQELLLRLDFNCYYKTD